MIFKNVWITESSLSDYWRSPIEVRRIDTSMTTSLGDYSDLHGEGPDNSGYMKYLEWIREKNQDGQYHPIEIQEDAPLEDVPLWKFAEKEFGKFEKEEESKKYEKLQELGLKSMEEFWLTDY